MNEFVSYSKNIYYCPAVPFAVGGEAFIFDVIDKKDVVAKVYKPDRRNRDIEDKVLYMVMNRPNNIQQYAWPLDVLYDNGHFVGYIMPRIDGKNSLRNIYCYDRRKGKPWSFYVTVAMNLCVAVHNVHEIHQVIGDLNPENILVNPNDGKVTLVDTDSYHISDSSRTYRCGVGMPEFVAPELQGIHFPSAPLPTFTPDSDRFALAVLIFSLLMNGAHPFACKDISGSSSKFEPINNIRNNYCIWLTNHRLEGTDIPRYAPEIDFLPVEIQNLFKRAFVKGHNNPSSRPTGEEWHSSLERLESNLINCLNNPQHIYYYEAKECPWCNVDKKMTETTEITKTAGGIFQYPFGNKLKNESSEKILKTPKDLFTLDIRF